jgi:hypothetical protein
VTCCYPVLRFVNRPPRSYAGFEREEASIRRRRCIAKRLRIELIAPQDLACNRHTFAVSCLQSETGCQSPMRYRLEAQFLGVTMALLAGLVTSNSTDAFSGFDSAVDGVLKSATNLGIIGVFAIAVLANASLLVQIPYTVPLLSLALAGSSLPAMLVMGTASGIGAGIGEVVSYALAERILGRNPRLVDSSLFQWVQRTLNRHRRLAPTLVFMWAASILPDDTVIIPLAMMRYGLVRIAWPLFAGKVVHGLLVSVLFYYATSWSAARVSTGVKTDLALGVLIVFVMLILYQVQRNRMLNESVPALAKPAIS